MSLQLLLDLAGPVASGFDVWVPGPNREATDYLRRQAETGRERIWLHGPVGSGRSHLLHAVAAAADAAGRSVILVPAREVRCHCESQPVAAAQALEGLETFDVVLIDDVHAWAGVRAFEEALFDLYNRLLQSQRLLVLTARAVPDRCGFELPDLASRLNAAVRFLLQTPDGDDLAALLRVQARRRGLRLDEAVCSYLLLRLARTPAAIVAALDALDAASLRDRVPISVRYAGRVLGLSG